MILRSFAALIIGATTLTACTDANQYALAVGAPPKDAASLRSLETRVLSAPNRVGLMRSTAATLQDLGFSITESAPQLGVIAGTKQRDAVEKGQVAGQIVATVLLAALGSYHAPVWDKSQQINITIVMAPATRQDQQQLRVSFDRYVTNNQDQLWRTELITDPKIYSGFFDDLTKNQTLDAGAGT